MGNSFKFTLKDIFTIKNLKDCCNNNNPYFHSVFSKEHYRHIKQTIINFLECCDYNKNYGIFKCPICDKKAVRPHSCKSRICPPCGKMYSQDIAANFANRMINKPHRHMLFTMPDYIWNFFIGNFKLLAKLSDLLYIEFKAYFKKHNIINFAFSVFIHTFGRDLKVNPHLHIIITEGGFNKNNTWKKLTCFHWEDFEFPWKIIITSILENNLPYSKELYAATNKLRKKESSIIFNVKGETLKNPEKTIKYLGRYLARAPIAEYKITALDNYSVTFWYNDIKDKQRKICTLPIDVFIKKLILQIPPKSFKMVRHYGVYARNISKKIKQIIKSSFSKYKFKLKRISWQQRIHNWIGINPLICPKCKVEMVLSAIIYKKKVYTFKT